MSVHYKDLSDRAYYYHSNNQFKQAEEIYLQLLQINPDDVNILNLLGTLYIVTKKYDDAIKYISKAFLLKKTSYLATNLAKAYFLNNQIKDAVKLYNTALEFGQSDDLYYSLAIAYKKLREFDKAIECYLKAIELNPDNYNAMYNLALIYKNKSDIDSAIYYINLCIRIKPDDDDLYSMLSECYDLKKDYKLALEYINKAISYNKKNNLYYYNSACLYVKSSVELENNFKKFMINYVNMFDINTFMFLYFSFILLKNSIENNAVIDFKNSIQLNKNHVNSYINLSNVLYFQDKINECIEVLSELVKVTPKNAHAYSMLASRYLETGDYEKANSCFDNALNISGITLNILQGKAYALRNLGKVEEAKCILEKIVKVPNHNYISDISLGMIYLTEKNFEKGYKLYRNRNKDTKITNVFSPEKIWNKNVNFDDKNVIVYSNCGFGDTIMYSRYINILKDKVKKLIIETDNELISLLKYNFKDIEIIKKGIIPSDYDVVIPFMDIQYALDMDFDNIPGSRGYLKAKKSKSILTNKKKIGLYFKGSDKVFTNRSVSFELFKEIIKNDKFEFYSFQPDSEYNEINNLNKYINDFSDSASLLKEMDVLITVDSAVAHLAGALGVKTFLMLPFCPEWRWFDDKKKTPWYDSVTIFKQDKLNDWSSVISDIQNEIDIICK